MWSLCAKTKQNIVKVFEEIDFREAFFSLSLLANDRTNRQGKRLGSSPAATKAKTDTRGIIFELISLSEINKNSSRSVNQWWNVNVPFLSWMNSNSLTRRGVDISSRWLMLAAEISLADFPLLVLLTHYVAAFIFLLSTNQSSCGIRTKLSCWIMARTSFAEYYDVTALHHFILSDRCVFSLSYFIIRIVESWLKISFVRSQRPP